jgi:NADH-quinone oxidoreductase subunit L
MDQQTLVYLIWAIPLLPLTAFFLIMLFTRGHDRLSHTVAIGAMALSFILAQIVFWNVVGNGEELAAHPIIMSIPWLPGPNPLNMGVLVDPLTAVMLFMVPLA